MARSYWRPGTLTRHEPRLNTASTSVRDDRLVEAFAGVLAALYLVAGAVLLAELRHLHLRPRRPFLALVVWLVLRAASAIAEPLPRPTYLAILESVLDATTVAILAYLVLAGRPLVRTAARTVRRAGRRADEYERARRDYTQVVIHRLFNPLTVIRGAAQTLQARELDEATRMRLLEAIVSASREIERVTLEPGRRRPEEVELQPLPAAAEAAAAAEPVRAAR